MSKATHRFVGGTGRSGTSVMIESLGMHPEVFPFWESKFIPGPGGVFSYLHGLRPPIFKTNLKGKWLQKINACFKSKKLNYEITSKQMALLASETLSHADRVRGGAHLISTVMNHAKKASGCPVVVEKTPHTVKMVDDLYKMFGDGLRYVHCIRDPRDIYFSQKALNWVRGPVGFVPEYLNIINRAYLAAKQIPRECYVLIELENIKVNVDNYMRWLHNFLEFPQTEKIPHKFRHEYADSSGLRVRKIKPDNDHRLPEAVQVWSLCSGIYLKFCEEFSLKPENL